MSEKAYRKPLVGLGLLFILGICAGLTASVPLRAPLGAACLLWPLAAAAAFSGTAWSRRASPLAGRVVAGAGRVALFATVFCAGCVSARLATARLAQDVRLMSAAAGQRVELIGIVVDDPSAEPARADRKPMAKFPLQVERVRAAGVPGWQDLSIQVQVRWAEGGGPAPRYGERWRLRGLVFDRLQRDPSRPWFALSRFSCYASHRSSQRLAVGQGNPLLQRCHAVRDDAAAALTRGIEHHAETVGFLRTLCLGYSYELPDEVRQDFAATGTLHIFAISGLHVAMLAGMLIFVLTACGIARDHWLLYLAPLLIAYTVATGMSPSAVRSCIMAIVFFLGPFLGRKADNLSGLSFAAIAILAVEPRDLFDIGFLLSFSAVLGLIVLYPTFNQFGQRRLRADPLRVQPERAPVRGLRFLGSRCWSLLAASGAAWLATAPICAYCFNNISVVGLLGNLVAVPLSFLIVFTACLALLCGACVRVLGVIFNHANLVLVAALVRSMAFMADLPASHFTVTVPGLWPVVAWYGGVALLALALARRRREQGAEAVTIGS